MEIKQTQNEVKQLMKVVNGKHRFPYPNIMSVLKAYEEMGELTQLIIESTVKSRKGGKLKIDDIKGEIGDELADLFIVILGLANDYDIQLEEHIRKKMKKHLERWTKVE
ncbi:MAG: hypothetical protein KKA79_03985 [Nanoarchaeota archaeon]|nr:hypothetical protein [Nanoarchaeota archaeon]MCG2718963.1 hypothetical protein [Nanoarchaeota archaeon]